MQLTRSDDLLSPDYGRSVIGAERRIASPRILYVRVRKAFPFADTLRSGRELWRVQAGKKCNKTHKSHKTWYICRALASSRRGKGAQNNLVSCIVSGT